ncbi:MAG: hypothetical protein RIB45_06425 [Marivibrio sp.]|uniref:hypothetical protein n=1 Tax=Marivibrio sp. TaxID=2039719 RepID=UPI0032F01B03
MRRFGFAALVSVGLAVGFWAAGAQTGARLAADGAAVIEGVFSSPPARPLSTRVTSRAAETYPRAPLTVRAHAELSHFIKLVEARTGETALTLTVAAGERTRTQIPYGRYEFRVASGKTWHGEERLFGPLGVTESARRPLVFGRAGGHEIDLNRRVDGNMAVDWTPKSGF